MRWRFSKVLLLCFLTIGSSALASESALRCKVTLLEFGNDLHMLNQAQSNLANGTVGAAAQLTDALQDAVKRFGAVDTEIRTGLASNWDRITDYIRQISNNVSVVEQLHLLSGTMIPTLFQAMGSGDALAQAIMSHPSTNKRQVYMASTMIALFGRSEKNIQVVFDGGMGAVNAMDTLVRDALLIEDMQKMLRHGDERGTEPLDPALVDTMQSLETVTTDYRSQMEAFVPLAESWIDITTTIDELSFEISVMIDSLTSDARRCDDR